MSLPSVHPDSNASPAAAMSYSKLPVSLDDINKIPRFTASQLIRALLIVIAEDSDVKASTFDPRMFLCVGCVNRSVVGERMMSFAWPDPNASEEQKLIEQLQHIMYHRPGSPPPPSAPVPACSCRAAPEAGITPASGSNLRRDVEGADEDSTNGPILGYFDTVDAPATLVPIVRSPFDPEWDPKTPWFAPPSDSTTWYAVTVGKRVGVFDQSVVAASATDGVPSNARKCFPSRNAAMKLFQDLVDIPGVVRVVDMA